MFQNSSRRLLSPGEEKWQRPGVWNFPTPPALSFLLVCHRVLVNRNTPRGLRFCLSIFSELALDRSAVVRIRLGEHDHSWHLRRVSWHLRRVSWHLRRVLFNAGIRKESSWTRASTRTLSGVIFWRDNHAVSASGTPRRAKGMVARINEMLCFGEAPAQRGQHNCKGLHYFRDPKSERHP